MVYLSIIIPIYNVEEHINRCLESFETTSPDKIEIILVDDGSKDKSGQIADSFAVNNSNAVCYHKINGGLSDARNFGLLRAKGKYIWFVDSDDYVDKNSIDALIVLLNTREVDILAFSAFKTFNSSSETIKNTMSDSILTGKQFLFLQYSNHTFQPEVWHNVYKREFLIENKLMFKKGLLHEDEDFSPRVFYFANSVSIIDNAFYYYVVRENSIMTKKDLVKNFYDLGKTIRDYLNFEADEKLKLLIIDRLVDKYLSVFAKGKLCKKVDIECLGFRLLFKYSFFFKTKIKVFTFGLSKRLFCYISDSMHKR